MCSYIERRNHLRVSSSGVRSTSPPPKSLLRIRVCQRKELTFKDPSGIVSTGLPLRLTATFDVSAGASLVAQSALFPLT